MSPLRCQALSKSFDGVHALQNLTVQFPPSGIVGIVGPNGAGKTTLVNILTGSIQANAGAFYLGERELTHTPPHKIARLGISRTFQDLRLISQLSALENVLLAKPEQKGEGLLHALLRYGVAAEETQNQQAAIRSLSFVGLADAAAQSAGELSYGQQKLLTLACCLATGAKILILDEPVAGVHQQVIEQILDLLSQLRSLGKLVVFVEHDLDFVRRIADLVLVMDEGKIIADGRPSEVLARPEVMEAYIT